MAVSYSITELVTLGHYIKCIISRNEGTHTQNSKTPKLSEYLLFQDTDLSVGGSLTGTTPVPQDLPTFVLQV